MPTNIIFYVVLLLLVLYTGYLVRRDLNRLYGWSLFRRHRTIPDMVARMTPVQFEQWTMGLFHKIGALAEVSGGRGDHGIDLRVRYRGLRIGVQCKKYYRVEGHKYFHGFVGEPVLRDMYGAQRHGNFDKAVLITTGRFTASAKKWAKGKRDLILIDQYVLADVIKDPELLAEWLEAPV